MRTPRLPVVVWTDAPTDLNGLVLFAKRRNLVSARVPSHFKRSLLCPECVLSRYYRWPWSTDCTFICLAEFNTRVTTMASFVLKFCLFVRQIFACSWANSCDVWTYAWSHRWLWWPSCRITFGAAPKWNSITARTWINWRRASSCDTRSRNRSECDVHVHM